MNIENQIYIYINKNNECSPAEIMDELKVSRQYIHRCLNNLLKEGKIEKIGKAPKVYYRINSNSEKNYPSQNLKPDLVHFIEAHFNTFTTLGEELNGLKAFEYWCRIHKLALEKTAIEYLETRKKYLRYYQKNQLINGTEKLQNTNGLNGVYVDELFYGDFYAIERFGKTKLGNLLHFGKQAQNRVLMDKIIQLIQPRIQQLIFEKQIDAIGFIPPTIKRNLQIMHYFKKKLGIMIPSITIVKVSGDIPIPQKALSKIVDRVQNANSSIVVSEKRFYKHILLIDDAVGSGATINETAKKIKSKQLASKVFAFAVTGSYKGFEILQEV